MKKLKSDEERLKLINNVGFWLISFILAIGVALFILNIQGCREALPTNAPDTNVFWQCDTINVKYNPAKDETTCTIRCRDGDGNEYIAFIPCPNELP